MKTKKQDTYLPIFSGYYHSIFDQSENFIEYELGMSDDELKEYYSEVFKAGVSIEFFRENFYDYLDFRKAEEGSNEYLCNGIIDLDHADIIESVTYQSMSSPRYYNFSTDSINCEIEYNHEKLKDFILHNYDQFKKYLERKYTSCDGFRSSYSNDIKEWLPDIIEGEIGDHELGSILDFIFEVNHGDDAQCDLYHASDCTEGYYNGIEFDAKKMIEDYKNKGE